MVPSIVAFGFKLGGLLYEALVLRGFDGLRSILARSVSMCLGLVDSFLMCVSWGLGWYLEGVWSGWGV